MSKKLLNSRIEKKLGLQKKQIDLQSYLKTDKTA